MINDKQQPEDKQQHTPPKKSSIKNIEHEREKHQLLKLAVCWSEKLSSWGWKCCENLLRQKK